MTAYLSVGCFSAQVALINAGNVPSAFSPTITASRVVTAKRDHRLDFLWKTNCPGVNVQ